MANNRYDAIVVGSGATGGWAAKDLTERGLRVALIEAGPMLFNKGARGTPSIDPDRQPIQARCFAFEKTTAPLFVDDIDNPYSHPEDRPYDWIRSRQVGGRMLLWDRMCLRMSDYEFKAASRDGVGDDWPISYADLAPYYDRVERFLEVTGTAEGLPHVPDGEFAAPPALSAGEKQLKLAVESHWATRTVTSARIAMSPPEATLVAAMRTGRLSLHADSIASHVTLEPGGNRARGIAYVDRISGREREIEASVVILCASTIESTRLLLNSATDEHPKGLGNSSGLLGRYLMDHTASIGLEGWAAPSPRGTPDSASQGCVIPSFRGITEPGNGFARGYEIALQILPQQGGLSTWLRNRGRRRGGWFWMRAFGEVLPEPDNRVTIHPSLVDAWGIPIVHIECRYGENEHKMAADQLQCMQGIADVGGLRVTETYSELKPPGLSIHEVGTARMGSDPATSVLDPFNRSWDVENLFVTDGSCFVSSGFQNPTLTMMAITARACERLVERLGGGSSPEDAPVRGEAVP